MAPLNLSRLLAKDEGYGLDSNISTDNMGELIIF
jgi:hypothetical protein